jgi:DNA-directed RNA polymerase subunit RPC12/RpoP
MYKPIQLTTDRLHAWLDSKIAMKGYYVCDECGNKINGKTDDNYNSSHSKIQCPECNHWQYVDI